MPGDFYPAALQGQNPDVLASYLRGSLAPLQQAVGRQQLALGAGELQEQPLKLEQLRLALQQQRLTSTLAQQLVSGNTQGAGAQSEQSPTGGIQNGPQGAVSGEGGPFSGGRVNTMMALDVLAGRDPLKTAQAAQEYELKQRQLQAQGPLALMDSIAGAQSPALIVMNNPGLLQRWKQIAPQLGFNPANDFNDANVRQAIGFARNQVAGAAGLPTTQMPRQAQQIRGPNGQLLSKDPITGEVKQEVPEESLHQVINPQTGQPILLPASQAAGKQPFNQSIFGASSLGDQAKEFAYQSFVATGKMPANFGRNPAMQASLMDYISKRAAEEGNSAASIAAKGQAFTAQQAVVKDFTSGTTGKNLTAINTAVAHIDSLTPLVDALGTGDIKQINRLTNAFKEQTGQSAPTNYAALKEFVGGEVAKSVLPGGGGEKEREALLAPLNAANSPQAIHDALKTIQVALAGKTEALRNQWDVGTNGSQGNFNKFLLPETKKALGITDASAPSVPAGTKTVTQAQVKDYATKHGLSLSAALQHVKASGFTVQ